MTRRTPVVAVLAAAALVAGGALTGAAVSGDDPSRQEAVAERGARVATCAPKPMHPGAETAGHVVRGSRPGLRTAIAGRTSG